MWFKHPSGQFVALDLVVQSEGRFFDDQVIKDAVGIHRFTKMQTLRRDIMRIVLADGALGTVQPMRDLIDDMLKIHGKSNAVRNLRRLKSRDESTVEEAKQVNRYEKLENLILVAEHKQLFHTNNFLHGMASAGIQAGDKIANLYGCKVPCVLRAGNLAENEYRVISQCSLDGWMFGRPRADVPRPHPRLKWWVEEADDFVLV